MYRDDDMEKIDKSINKIKDDASRSYKSQYEPTLKEMSDVYSAVIGYIKRKKKIAYGGFAQNILVKQKNKSDSFYEEIDGVFFNWPDVADIEFYSSTPIQDTMELTEELHAKGFKYVEGGEGVHSETYKIFVNFINYCDISYTPVHILNNMPTITVDGIICTHPHFMLVDAYRVLNDPMTSYWRLDKSIKRFQKILRYYPIDNSLVDKKIELKSTPDVLDYIRKSIIHNSKLVVVGFYAYNYYIKKQDKKAVLKDIPFYELISSNLEKDGKMILDILRGKFGDKITVKEYCLFFSFTDRRIEYYYNGHLMLRLYGNNERCTVYRHSKKKKTYFGTFSLTLMYMFFNYFYNMINKDRFYEDTYKSLISKMMKIRDGFLKEHNMTVVDKSPFQDFTLKCIGYPVDMMRESRLRMIEKKKEGKRMKFRYNPSGKMTKVPEFSFSNCSGNEILNDKNKLIKL